jgi:hypothetical protein
MRYESSSDRVAGPNLLILWHRGDSKISSKNIGLWLTDDWFGTETFCAVPDFAITPGFCCCPSAIPERSGIGRLGAAIHQFAAIGDSQAGGRSGRKRFARSQRGPENRAGYTAKCRSSDLLGDFSLTWFPRVSVSGVRINRQVLASA